MMMTGNVKRFFWGALAMMAASAQDNRLILGGNFKQRRQNKSIRHHSRMRRRNRIARRSRAINARIRKSR